LGQAIGPVRRGAGVNFFRGSVGTATTSRAVFGAVEGHRATRARIVGGDGSRLALLAAASRGLA